MNLGDIYRYHSEIKDRYSQKKWPLAAKYYKEASKLNPNNGNPHNQLAVFYSLKKDKFNTVYYYIRAFACSEPFLICIENLSSLFKKTSLQLSDPKTLKIKESIFEIKNRSEKDINSEMEVFVSEFIQIHESLSPFKE